MEAFSSVNVVIGLAGAPLMVGIINRTKAFFAGRRGQPLLQGYFDIVKLMRKGAVYSTTTTWVFRAGPMVGLGCAITALGLMPFGGTAAPLGFGLDFLMLAYIFGLGRFFTVAAALDTGSAFEGMGASREVLFSALAEPALLLGLICIARSTEAMTLSAMLAQTTSLTPSLVLVVVALFIVYLCENARIPFDDPNTHLELTMIHEVMILDHSGPDLAFIFYGAALKLWVLGALIVGLLIPAFDGLPRVVGLSAHLVGMFVLAIGVGIVESVMARLRLVRVPQLLIAACALSALAVVLP